MNTLRCVDRKEIGEAPWDKFVDACDEAWLYHRYALLDALKSWPARTDASFAVVEKDTIVAVVPAQVVVEPFAKVLKRKIIDVFGGVAISKNVQRAGVIDFTSVELWRKARAHGAGQISFSISSLTPAVVPLDEWNCRLEPAFSWLVDLRTGREELWKKMEGRARTAIRKAENAGVKVRQANRPGDLDVYYRLHEETYHRTHAAPHAKKYFELIWRHFKEKGLAHVFFAEYQGQVVAAENFAVYKKAADYWTGASSQTGLSVGANSLLQWSAIKWMTENQIDWYNCGEAFPRSASGKLKGLSDFKKSFGGKLTPLYRGSLFSGLRSKWIHRYLTYRRLGHF